MTEDPIICTSAPDGPDLRVEVMPGPVQVGCLPAVRVLLPPAADSIPIMGDDSHVPHPLDKDDIQVVPMDRPECEECGDPATHLVQADWRNAGQVFGLGIFCEECAERTADRLRDALPEPIPDGEDSRQRPEDTSTQEG